MRGMRLPCYADSPTAIEALTRDGRRLLGLGNLKEAEYVLARAAGTADHLPATSEAPLIRLRAREALAVTYRLQGRHSESAALFRSTIAKAERELEPGAAVIADLLSGLATTLDALERQTTPTNHQGGTNEPLRNPAT